MISGFSFGVRDENGVFTGALGSVGFSLASAIFAKGSLSFTLFPNCYLDLYISLSDSYSQGVRLQLGGQGLQAPDNRPLASYVAVLLCTPERNILLHKSSVIKGEKNPVWSDFVLPLHLLQFYVNAPIQVHCFNYNVNTADSLIGLLFYIALLTQLLFIGYFSTTLGQLQQGAGSLNSYMVSRINYCINRSIFQLTDSQGTRLPEKTCISLMKIEQTKVDNLLQLFKKK